ncbi:hypothetical protein GQ457_01G036170 [Hibiscus cannabinus]
MEKTQTRNKEKEEKWSYNSNIKTQTEESEICAWIVNAETGLGKTIAYLAPIIHQLQGLNTRIERSHGTFALVLVPTHELCMQLYAILQQLSSSFIGIVPGYVMDGEKRTKARRRLRKEFWSWDLAKILDLLGSRAGKFVGMGNPSESQRQNLLLPATLNEQVNHLAKISLENPVMIGLDKVKMQPDRCGTLGDLMCEFNARREAGKRPAGELSPSPSPAKKVKAGAVDDEKIAKGISSCKPLF